ncbi:MAG: lasso peptide biosynthesis B2 protein [Acidimicrobiales bacterium]
MSVALRIRRWWRRMRHLVDLPAVLVWFGIVEVGIRRRPLATIARRFGVPLATADRTDTTSGRPELSPRERRWLRLTDVVGPRWPFCEGPCLRQALVAGHALRRHSPLLRIGVALEDASVIAHAWLEIGPYDLGRSDRFESLVAVPE